jgi:hypothetical protein
VIQRIADDFGRLHKNRHEVIHSKFCRIDVSAVDNRCGPYMLNLSESLPSFLRAITASSQE